MIALAGWCFRCIILPLAEPPLILGILLPVQLGGFSMDHITRLELTGKVTYYIGWISLLCGGLMHFSVATNVFLAMRLTQRNLFEISVACFIICIASELRAHDIAGLSMSGGLKRAA
jgi:hypothetical protein